MKPQKTFPKMGVIALMALLLSCLQQMAMAQGNLVYNGGFDTSSNGFTPDGWSEGSFELKDGDPPPDLVLGANVAASQTIDGLTIGDLYTVSGNYMGFGSDTTNISFEVLLNDTAYFETAVPTNPNWQSFSFQYTATSSSVELTLWQTMGGYLTINDYSVDNIAMYAVPEPASLSLICVGGIILAFFFRNRPVGQASCLPVRAASRRPVHGRDARSGNHLP